MPLLLRLLGRVRTSQAWLLGALAVACVLVGAVAFSLVEHVSLGIGLYWAFTTATTVGYGDVTPHNTAGRIVAVALMLTAIPLAGGVFAVIAAEITATRLGKLLQVGFEIERHGFVAVVGSHRSIGAVAEELARAGAVVRIVSTVELHEHGTEIEHLQLDPTDEANLRRARLERAERVMVVGVDDAETLLVGVLVRELAPAVPVLAVASSAKVREALSGLGVEASVAVDELLVHTLAKAAETPHAGNLLLELVASERVRLREVEVGPELQGHSLAEAAGALGSLVLGRVHDGSVELAVGLEGIRLEANDRIIVVEERRGGQRP